MQHGNNLGPQWEDKSKEMNQKVGSGIANGNFVGKIPTTSHKYTNINALNCFTNSCPVTVKLLFLIFNFHLLVSAFPFFPFHTMKFMHVINMLSTFFHAPPCA